MSKNIYDREKKNWQENEKRIRAVLIGFICAIILLIIIIIFFKSQIWAIITNIAIILGLAVDLITLIEKGKGV